MKNVSIVLVNWNGYKDTLACLRSLRKLKTKGVSVTTIVVDNGSTNDSVMRISEAFPDVILLRLSRNEGFSGGNNRGIRYAYLHGASYIWLLNNDTIVDPDALSLLEAFADPSVGIAGSKIYFAPGHEFHKDRYTKNEQGHVFWYAGGLIDWRNMYASHRGVDEVDHGQYDQDLDTDFVTGCSLMMRREVVETVGYLDDRFFLYLEDLDYGLRAKDAGYRLLYYPKSVVWHVNAGSSGGAGKPIHDYYFTRNRLLIGFRYAPLRTKLALVRESLRFLLSRQEEKKRAVMDALFMRFGGRYEKK